MTSGAEHAPQPPPPPSGAEAQPAPPLAGGEWLQGGPVDPRNIEGPLLVDFWDYSSIHWLRTLPYLAEWRRRYEPHGLTIVGVHTPEFDFARSPDRVREAIADLGVEHPVVLDAGYAVWRAWGNRYWPSKHFVDARGRVRARHAGEGAYAESELLLQALLRERAGFEAELPPPMAPLRPEDAPGAVSWRVTPQLYCGYGGGAIGNPGGPSPDRPRRYADRGKHAEGALYLDGDWLVSAASAARPFGANGPGRLTLTCMAAGVHAVLHPPVAGGAGEARVLLDGAPLAGEAAGEDVEDGALRVERPRLYSLVRGADVERRTLTLETQSDGLAAFAFAFTSCVAPGDE